MRSYGTCPKCKAGLLLPSGAGGCNCTCELCGYQTRPEYLARESGSSYGSNSKSSYRSTNYSSGNYGPSKPTRQHRTVGKRSSGCPLTPSQSAPEWWLQNPRRTRACQDCPRSPLWYGLYNRRQCAWHRASPSLS